MFLPKSFSVNSFTSKRKIAPATLPGKELTRTILFGDKSRIREIIFGHPKLEALLQTELDTSQKQPYKNVFYALLAFAPDIAKEALDRLLEMSGSCEKGVHKLNYAFVDNIYIPNTDRALTSVGVTSMPLVLNKLILGVGGPAPAKEAAMRYIQKKANCVKPFTTSIPMLRKKHCLAFMAKHQQEALLKHPIVQCMLRQKWRSLSRWIFYSGFITWIFFLSFLIAFLSLQVHPTAIEVKISDAADDDNCTNISHSCCRKFRELYHNVWRNTNTYEALRYLMFVVLGIGCFTELVQLFFQRQYYFLSAEKLLNLAANALVACILFYSQVHIIPDACFPEVPGTQYLITQRAWQWEMGTIGVCLAWLAFMVYVRRLPHSGIYVIMFFDVLKTLLRFSFVLFICLSAFASAFFMLFPNRCPFDNVILTGLKTLVMTVGEYQLENMICSDDVYTLISPWLTYIMFATLIVSMTMVVLNLLIGLVVFDIKAIREKAIFEKLKLRASVVLDYEISIPFPLRRHVMTFEETVSCKELRCHERRREQKADKQITWEDLEILQRKIEHLTTQVASLKQSAVDEDTQSVVTITRF